LNGAFSKSWLSLAPGATVSTTVDLESTRAGTFYTHPAELTYKPSADSAETVRWRWLVWGVVWLFCGDSGLLFGRVARGSST